MAGADWTDSRCRYRICRTDPKLKRLGRDPNLIVETIQQVQRFHSTTALSWVHTVKRAGEPTFAIGNRGGSYGLPLENELHCADLDRKPYRIGTQA
jgi:hypothetical protein